MTIKNSILILSGFNPRGIIAFCRFCKKNKIVFYIVASGPEDNIHQTDYKKNIIYTREGLELNIKHFLKYKREIENKKNGKKVVILPSSEYLNRFLLDNKAKLEDNQFIVPLTSNKLYQEISNKYSFGELCQNNDLNIPIEFENVNSDTVPFVAKAKTYFIDGKITNDKPILVMNKEDYNSFLSKRNQKHFYFQEFVGGESFYLLFYFSKNGDYSVYSQKNLIQQDKGLSIIGAKSSKFHENEVTKKYAKLLTNLGFTGLVMIELKVYNEKTYMIEANPRLWGPSQLILDANMDLFHRFAMDNGLITDKCHFKLNYTDNVSYFWSGGITQDISRDQKPVFHEYDEKLFFIDYKDWVKNDIYLKQDSIANFLSELKNI